MAAKWQTANTYIANNDEYWKRLKDKLLEEVEKIRQEKRQKRGGFEEKIILITS